MAVGIREQSGRVPELVIWAPKCIVWRAGGHFFVPQTSLDTTPNHISSTLCRTTILPRQRSDYQQRKNMPAPSSPLRSGSGTVTASEQDGHNNSLNPSRAGGRRQNLRQLKTRPVYNENQMWLRATGVQLSGSRQPVHRRAADHTQRAQTGAKSKKVHAPKAATRDDAKSLRGGTPSTSRQEPRVVAAVADQNTTHRVGRSHERRRPVQNQTEPEEDIRPKTILNHKVVLHDSEPSISQHCRQDAATTGSAGPRPADREVSLFAASRSETSKMNTARATATSATPQALSLWERLQLLQRGSGEDNEVDEDEEELEYPAGDGRVCHPSARVAAQPTPAQPPASVSTAGDNQVDLVPSEKEPTEGPSRTVLGNNRVKKGAAASGGSNIPARTSKGSGKPRRESPKELEKRREELTGRNGKTKSSKRDEHHPGQRSKPARRT